MKKEEILTVSQPAERSDWSAVRGLTRLSTHFLLLGLIIKEERQSRVKENVETGAFFLFFTHS
jgi:hypothetical protein